MTLERLRNLGYFFIIGRGRSGTTLLQSLLDAHPKIAVPIESRFIIHLYEKYHAASGFTDQKIDRFLEDLFTETKINFWEIDRQHLRSNLLTLGAEAEYADYCKCISLSYNRAYDNSDICLIGDKNPIHTLFLNQLDSLFPNAKYIHLVRDYRDNALSHKLTFGENNLKVQGYLWNHFVNEAEAFGRQNPDRCLRIHYEQLAKEPDTVLKAVSSFLNIDYVPDVLDFHKEGKERHKALEPLIEKVHPTLFRPINETAVKKWKTKLSEQDIVQLDQICHPLAGNLGYEPASSVSPKVYRFSWFRATAQMKLVKFLYGISISKRIFLMQLLARIFRNPVNEFVKSRQSKGHA